MNIEITLVLIDNEKNQNLFTKDEIKSVDINLNESGLKHLKGEEIIKE